MSTFDFDELAKKKGTKTKGFLDIAQKPDGSWIRIPYMMVVGAKDGPTFLGEGGVHGDEIEGAEALAIVANAVDPEKLSGIFLAIPHLNLEAFNIGKRAMSSTDYTCADMNRVMPGDPVNGKMTAYLASVYVDKFVRHADFIVSFHGGGNTVFLEPLCSYVPPEVNPEMSALTYEAAKAFGVRVLWRESMPFEGTLSLLANKLGIPCMMAEVGGNSCAYPLKKQMLETCVNGVWNILKHLKMIDGEVKLRDDYVDVSIQYLHTTHGGIFRTYKKPFDECKKGEVMSEVYNVFGEKIDECVAPYDGVIIGLWTASVLQPRDWTFLYGKKV